jgi:6-phosphofructokinase 1
MVDRAVGISFLKAAILTLSGVVDRLISLRFGAAAVRMIEAKQFGNMVALDPPEVKAIPFDEVIDNIKQVPIDGDTIQTARDMGISFGD